MTARRYPTIDRRTREGRAAADLRRELDQRIGGAPSIEARQLAAQIVRLRHAIDTAERRRAAGQLSETEAERQHRQEGLLARALRRLERLCPAAQKPTGRAVLDAYLASKAAEKAA